MEKTHEVNIVRLRLIRDGQSVGQGIEVKLLGHSRRGLLVEMESPFIDNQHIMMSMPDGAACHLQVSHDIEQAPKIAEVIRLNREKSEDSEKAWFVVELGYVNLERAPTPSKVWAPFRRKSGPVIRGGEDF